ncbi:hypothetical protein [Actinoplanes sp. M2I2]|nr:hypothetical protein [Actinoplanes sp. M2I2]
MTRNAQTIGTPLSELGRSVRPVLRAVEAWSEAHRPAPGGDARG